MLGAGAYRRTLFQGFLRMHLLISLLTYTQEEREAWVSYLWSPETFRGDPCLSGPWRKTGSRGENRERKHLNANIECLREKQGLTGIQENTRVQELLKYFPSFRLFTDVLFLSFSFEREFLMSTCSHTHSAWRKISSLTGSIHEIDSCKSITADHSRLYSVVYLRHVAITFQRLWVLQD